MPPSASATGAFYFSVPEDQGPMATRSTPKKDVVEITFIDWCRKWNYNDIADMVEGFISKWAAAGNGTRRNWWDKFAGLQDGRHCKIEGQELPILQAARKRKGWPMVSDAICRNKAEEIPGISLQTRWDGK